MSNIVFFYQINVSLQKINDSLIVSVLHAINSTED
jgi:hypothetical protein